VKKNSKSLSLSKKSELKSFTKPKKEFKVGTYIRKLIGVSDERWSRGVRIRSGARRRFGVRI
jgi:hypothetical protein